MLGMTVTHLQVMQFMFDFIRKEQWAPTFVELCKGVGVKSKSTMYNLLNDLESSGFIEREKGSARAIRFTEKGKRAMLRDKGESRWR